MKRLILLASIFICFICSSVAAQNGIVQDRTGARIGALLTKQSDSVTVVTSTGYIALINNDGTVGSVDSGEPVHLNATCSDALRAQINPGTLKAFSPGVSEPSSLFYAPADAVAVPIPPGATYYRPFNGGCFAVASSPDAPSKWFVPILPNDPAVTGISDSAYAVPFRLVLNMMYFDGFDP